MTNPAYIYDYVRTPRGKGKKDGTLNEVTALSLSSLTLNALKKRNNLNTKLIDDVILGCVSPIGEQGACIGRAAVLDSDYDICVPGQQINRFCASGLEAVGLAALKVNSGGAAFAIGGGVESMSRVPMSSDGGALSVDPNVYFQTGLIPQGVAADLIATDYGFTREELDQFALSSHQKASKAQKEGAFENSMIAVTDINNHVILDHDEMIRHDASLPALAQLKPAFEMIGKQFGFDGVATLKFPHIENINHIHTAGNSSAIVDGAAAVLVGSLSAGKKADLKPKAKIKAYTSIGSDPTMMLTGPLDVTKKLLKMAKMHPQDIDLWEINEAFSSIALMFQSEMNIDPSCINVYGGAIAMGHPLGATGAMIIQTVLDALIAQNKQTALIVLCVAAGMGSAMIIERV